MGDELAGQIAVLTGAAAGIGRGIAVELAKAGADICIFDLKPGEQAAALMEELRQFDVRSLYVSGDVSRREDVQALADAVESTLGPASIVVSNAITSERRPFLDTPFDELSRAVEVGIYGAFHVLQVFARRMVQNHIAGTMIQLTSPWAYLPYPGGMDYRIVKSAQHNMALSLATELMWNGIRVNLVEPGWVDTPGEHRWYSDDMLKAGGQALPFRRLCTPEDVGRAVAFVCREPYMTGAHIKIDGGLSHTVYSQQLELPRQNSR
ncbi:SDR family NAD(P)-dependent oxidoreductase [Sulfobacillus harzensis]|uniref:SDR family oxidoreductase n=1 Tax=Sulfobacillus harzensis TaxID=2729629 RepID=A0A7Y0L6G3_9FIRM|nr:SDR family oxidoreductase [Sulfobacillus harzensis]NMP22809.1 SDR family oxidoreductase [Sulfobacillus harzensis]